MSFLVWAREAGVHAVGWHDASEVAGGGDDSGESSRPSVQWVDLGVVTTAELVASGARTLYTTAGGEFISAVRFGDDFTVIDQISLEIDLMLGAWNAVTQRPYGTLTSSGVVDAAGSAVNSTSLFNDGESNLSRVSPPLLAGSLVAAIAMSSDKSFVGATPGWQANHAYPDSSAIIASGHFWDLGGDPGGASGGSTPDFAGNIGGSVVDGEITWWDEAPAPTVGSFHVYIEVVTPAADVFGADAVAG